MGISIFNSEGYLDLTASNAVNGLDKKNRRWVPLAYICYPDTGSCKKNRKMAIKYGKTAVHRDVIPISAELFLSQIMVKDRIPEDYSLYDSILFGRCEEVWVFGDCTDPEVKRIIKRADKYKKKIRYFTEDMEEVTIVQEQVSERRMICEMEKSTRSM